MRINAATEDIVTGKVVQLPTNEPAIRDVQAAKDALYVAANEGTSGVLYRVGYDGKAEKIKPPIEGSVTSSHGVARSHRWLIKYHGLDATRRYV